MNNKTIYLLIIYISIIFIPLSLKAQGNGIALSDTEAWYYQATGDNAYGKTVLILPGGGYSHHAMDHEGFDWVPFFNEQGVNVAVLKYKLPEGNYETPLNDVKKTIETLQKNADEWNINPEDIGIMGSSAGGHLASTYAISSEGKTKPAFQILFYPVISLKPELTHKGTKDSFLGSDQSEERILLFSGEEQVSSSTPPAILFHSYDDKAVVCDNSINYFLALRKAGVNASLHIYPDGGHGWGFRHKFPYHEAVLEELSIWLKNNNTPRSTSKVNSPSEKVPKDFITVEKFKPEYMGTIEAGHLFPWSHFLRVTHGIVNLTTIHGMQFKPWLFAGAGIGGMLFYHKNGISISVPLYLNGRLTLPKKNFRPYFDLKFGIKPYNHSFTFFNPSIGYKFAWGKKAGVRLSIGAHIFTARYFKAYNGVTASLGFDF